VGGWWGEKVHTELWGGPEGKRPMEDLKVDRRILLKCISRK
jgi:hypothetical protein